MPVRFHGLGRESEFFYNVMLRQGVQQAFLSFFALGTLERFPRLRLGVLESGCGWIGAFLDRMDAVSETISGRGARLGAAAERATSAASASSPAIPTRPRRRSSSTTSARTASCGRPTIRTPTTRAPGRAALERFVAPLAPATRAKVLGENVRRIYGLDA